MRKISYRVDVLRDNAKVTELKGIEPPRVNGSMSSDIRTSFSGIFNPNEACNLLRDELQVFALIDGVETSLGIFVPTTVTVETDECECRHWSIEAYDRTVYAEQTKRESMLTVYNHETYLNAVKAELYNAHIFRSEEDAASTAFTYDRTDWEVGDSELEIVNGLLSEINYQPLHFDREGVAQLRKKPSTQTTTFKRSFSDGSSVLQGAIFAERAYSFEQDLFEAPNVYIAVCQNADNDVTYIATCENSYEWSRISTLNRGRRIQRVERVNNISDAGELNMYAQQMMNEDIARTETLTINTELIPETEIGDPVYVAYGDHIGIYEVSAYTIVLAPGEPMQQTLSRRQLI